MPKVPYRRHRLLKMDFHFFFLLAVFSLHNIIIYIYFSCTEKMLTYCFSSTLNFILLYRFFSFLPAVHRNYIYAHTHTHAHTYTHSKLSLSLTHVHTYSHHHRTECKVLTVGDFYGPVVFFAFQIYIYIYFRMCVCVCVSRVTEREGVRKRRIKVVKKGAKTVSDLSHGRVASRTDDWTGDCIKAIYNIIICTTRRHHHRPRTIIV